MRNVARIALLIAIVSIRTKDVALAAILTIRLVQVTSRKSDATAPLMAARKIPEVASNPLVRLSKMLRVGLYSYENNVNTLLLMRKAPTHALTRIYHRTRDVRFSTWPPAEPKARNVSSQKYGEAL